MRFTLCCLLTLCFVFAKGQNNDSTKKQLSYYKVKFSLGYNCAFTNVKYSESNGIVYNSMTDGLLDGTTTISSSYQCLNKIPPILLPELNTDFELPKHFKFTLGFFLNKANFTTPYITSTEKGESYGYTFQSMSNYTLTSTTISYSAGPSHQDNINLLFLGTSLGTGYTFKKDKFLFDLDAGLKILWSVKSYITQTYSYSSYYQSSIYNGSNGFYDYNDKADQSGSHSTKIVASYIKASAAYMLIKHMYFNIGVSYTASFYPLHGDFGNSYEFNNSYKYSFNIQQFAIHAGLAFTIK